MITCLEPGGAEKQLLLLVAEQTKRYERVNVVYLKGPGTLKEQFHSHGANTVKVPKIYNFLAVRKFLKQVKESNLVHAHLPRSELLVALLAFLYDIKFVVSKHNTESFIPNGPTRLSRFLALFVENRAFKVICISNAVYEFLNSIREVRDEKKYSIVHYGIKKRVQKLDISDSPNLHSEFLQVNGEKHRVSVLCVARLTEQKNLPFLLRVMNILPEWFTLTILGEGHLRKFIEHEIETLGLSNRVFLKGFVKNVEDYLDSLDVLVLPSLYEGFGMILLEAVKCNISIVASDISVVKEVLGATYPFLAPANAEEIFAKRVRESTSWPSKDKEVFYSKILDKFSIDNSFRALDSIYRDVSAI